MAYDTRLVGDSDAARELREMSYEEEEYAPEDDEEEYTSDLETEAYQDEEFDPQSRYLNYDEGDNEETAPEIGNFWSNPKQKMDPYPDEDVQTTQPRRRQRPPSTAVPHRRRPRRGSRRRSTQRTTFRSGTPPPPGALKDFYNRLFWYGFDSENIASTSDKTAFGGSRGKFNGLEYMKQVKGKPFGTPHRERRSPRRPPLRNDQDQFYDDSEDYDNDEDSYDLDDEQADSRPRRRRKSDSDWVSDEVSSWFLPGNTDKRMARGGRKKKENNPWNILEQLLNIDEDEEMKYKAEMYNKRLGMRSRDKTPRREPSNDSRNRRRTGYSSRYVDDDPSVMDIHAENVDETPINESSNADPSWGKEDSISDEESDRPKRSWMDRAQAVERVPPSGVAAWGPSGEMGIDARTKATLDALEEVRSAKRKLDAREKRAAVAKENMVVVRADVELQKKRLLANKGSRSANDMLRQIEMEVDDASMALRRAKAQVAAARERLEELEEKNWALISLYDAGKFRDRSDDPDPSDVDKEDIINDGDVSGEDALDKSKWAMNENGTPDEYDDSP